MKKKLVIGALIAVLAVGMVMAFTACGVNGSPESVTRTYLEAMMVYDADKMFDTLYFENEADREKALDAFKQDIEEELGLSYDIDAKITKFDFESTPVSEEELAAAKEDMGAIGEKVEAIEKCKVVFSYEVTVTITVDGNEVTNTDSAEDEEAEPVVYKIDGKWYVGIVPAGQTDIGM